MHFPGYLVFRSKAVGSVDRGGAMVLVRNCIAPLVHDVDLSVGDHRWCFI